jgi:hypothetical protein
MANESILACPHCAGHILHDPSLAGQILECPHCRQHFQMPTLPLPQSSGAGDQGNQIQLDPFEAFGQMVTEPLKDGAASWDTSAQELHEQRLKRIADGTAGRLRNARDPSYIIRNIWIIALVFGCAAWIAFFVYFYISMANNPPRVGAIIASAVFGFPLACGIAIVMWVLSYLFCYETYQQMRADFVQRKLAIREHRDNALRDEGPASECPRCQQSGTLLSRKRVRTDKIGHSTVQQKVPITDALGRVTGYILQPIQQSYRIAVLRRSYRCTRCAHEWHHDEQLLPGF